MRGKIDELGDVPVYPNIKTNDKLRRTLREISGDLVNPHLRVDKYDISTTKQANIPSSGKVKRRVKMTIEYEVEI